MLRIHFYNIFRNPTFRFIISCIAALILGSIFSSYTRSFNSSLMRAALLGAMSIVSYFSLVLIPLLITAFAVLYCKKICLNIICFFKVFSFVYCWQTISNMFFGHRWFICLFLMFTDAFVVFSVLFLCLIRTRGSAISYKRIFLSVYVICSIAWLFDYTVISSQLAYLINH